MRIKVPYGVQTGDLMGDGAILWSKADREARMMVDLATAESFRDARQLVGPDVSAATDFAGKIDLTGLPAGERVFYRVRFLDLGDYETMSEALSGSFAMPPSGRRNIRFVWSGDTAGQRWGIDPDFGGMRIYARMA